MPVVKPVLNPWQFYGLICVVLFYREHSACCPTRPQPAAYGRCVTDSSVLTENEATDVTTSPSKPEQTCLLVSLQKRLSEKRESAGRKRSEWLQNSIKKYADNCMAFSEFSLLKTLIEFHWLKLRAMSRAHCGSVTLPFYLYVYEVDHCNEYRWAISTKLLHNFSKFYDCFSYFLLEEWPFCVACRAFTISSVYFYHFGRF